MAFSKISAFLMLVILAACGGGDDKPDLAKLALAGRDWSGALRCPPQHLFINLGKNELCISYTLPNIPPVTIGERTHPVLPVEPRP